MDDFCWYMVVLHCWLAVIPLVECGLLESFQPKDDNPVELNEFLTNVLDHQNDFNYVKDVAKRYQNSRPQQQQQLQLSSSFEHGSAAREPLKLHSKMSPYNLHAKRHAHNYHALKKRLKNVDGKQRHRRHIKPLMLEEISERDDGSRGGEIMKKDVMDFTSAVHKTNKVHKHTDNGLSNHENGNNNMYYVDLEGKRDDNDRDDEKRSESEQATSSSSGSSNSEANNIKNSKLEMVDESGKAALSSPANDDDGSKLMKSEHDNTVDDTNYLAQQHINDNSGFEKALSYEIAPSAINPEKNYENPKIVNNAADNSADKSIVQQQQSEELPAAEKYQLNLNIKSEKLPEQQHYPVPPEKYSENALKQIPNIENMLLSSNKQDVNLQKPNTIVKHVGNSFIEIDKQRREDAEEILNQEEAENSLKDRREDLENFENEEDAANVPRSRIEESFQGRKLQFFDEAMINVDDGDEEMEYENFPGMMRPRRDFLDALGMKNEEDYSEDNPYKEDLKVNNTDVNNDTNIHKQTTEGHKGGCLVPGKTSGTTTTTKKPQSEIDNIKQILEEPKEAASADTVGSFKKEKQEKRAKKTQYSKIEDFDDVIEADNGEMRRKLRQVNGIEEKIMQNKDKIFKYDPGKQEDCKKKTREERNNVAAVSDWNKNAKNKKKKKNVQQHRINKKENSEELATVQSLVEATTGSGDPSNVTELETNNSTYEQVAHQMDMENEKLAQIVNGHFASKIVTSVFDELKKKSALKAKFFSGLSRKHMNYDGNIEVDIFKANETEGVDEARLLLEQITKVLNRLVLNQVRRKLCQRLPDDLKEYLHTIVNVKNPIEVASFVPNSQQGDFLFAYQQSPADAPPFNLRKLQETLVNLEGLLLSYHNLNSDCQERAQPVKDYIERHVKMLRKIVACPDHSCDSKANESSRKRDTVPFNSLIEKQLESVGLGQKNRFIPNFDVDAIVKSKMGRNGAKRAAPPRKFTEKFRKLQLAAEKVRQKREDERKIGEMFGMRKNKRSVDEFEEPVVYSLGS